MKPIAERSLNTKFNLFPFALSFLFLQKVSKGNKLFFFTILCTLSVSCYSYESPAAQIPSVESTIQYAYIYPAATIIFSALLIKYFILNPMLNYILKNNGSLFLANILYSIGARANAALLWKACSDNDTEQALKCLRYGADPRRAREHYKGPVASLFPAGHGEPYLGWHRHTNALQIACGYRNRVLVENLLKAGADVNDNSSYHTSSRPLDYALKTKFDAKARDINYDIVNLLLQHNALLACLQTCESNFQFRNKNHAEILGITFLKLSSEDKVIIPKYALKNIVNYLLFAAKGRYNWLTSNHRDTFYFLFSDCEREWIYYLCNMIHVHVKDEANRKKLLLKLYNIEIDSCYQKRLRNEIIKSVIANDNKTIIQQFENDEYYTYYCKWHLNTLFSIACERNNKIAAEYFYNWHTKAAYEQNELWRIAATMDTKCLKHLLKSLPKTNLEILKQKNEHNQTLFYLAITSNRSFRKKPLPYLAKCIAEDETYFFSEELNKVIHMKECAYLPVFLQFYNEHDTLKKLISNSAQKAEQSYNQHVEYARQECNFRIPNPQLVLSERIYSAFKQYIPKEITTT